MWPEPEPAPAPASLDEDYFEFVYGANADPWGFETSPYEAAKYEATLAALPNPRYDDAFEIGCSIGVLTERLATRCARLLAVDLVPDVLARAAVRCAALPQVRFARMSVPAEFPDGTFDLILLSEVGYYWSRADLDWARRRIVDALRPDGHLALVHWTPFVPDYPSTGDQVHEAFLDGNRNREGGSDRLLHLTGRRAEQYRLDVFARR